MLFLLTCQACSKGRSSLLGWVMRVPPPKISISKYFSPLRFWILVFRALLAVSVVANDDEHVLVNLNTKGMYWKDRGGFRA